MPDLSVIIPTRNRAARLRECLAAIAGQTFDPSRFEVIVVDNGSTDGTADVVAQARTEFALRYIREDRPGLHRGRHAGMNAAAAELLVFGDDDIVPEPSWLAAIHDGFTNSDAAMIGGRCLPKWEAPPPPWLAGLWESTRRIGTLSIIDLGDDRQPLDPFWVWGCNFSIRAPVLREARGFHPDAMPEELLRFRGDGESHVSRFAAARGYRALYHPRATVLHAVPASRMTFEYFRKRAFAQGVSESFTSLRGGPNPFPGRSWKNIAAAILGSDAIDRLLRALLPARPYLHAAMGGAYRRGFLWHQELFRTDPEIREWVLRPDYLS